MPPSAFLFSVAGLGVTLAGFSGLVAALRRGSGWTALDAFRLRQIPEMGLATTLIALLTLPVAALVQSDSATVRLICGLGLGFTVGHVVFLLRRVRSERIAQPARSIAAAVVANLVVVAAACFGLVAASAPAFELLLLAMLARPMLVFLLVVDSAARG